MNDFEMWVVDELEILDKQNQSLHKRAKESALRIKALEDALTQALESISIITNTVIKEEGRRMGELESWIKSELEKVDKQDRIEEEIERLHRVAIQRLHNQTLDAKGKANRMQYSIGERLNRMEYVLNKLLETLNNNTTK
jgi:hypothetical protein